MSGCHFGAQELIKKVSPQAVYNIHCYAHTLNLVLVDSDKCIDISCDFFLPNGGFD